MMPAEVLRLFVFARHAESTANAAHILSSDPSRPVALTARGRVQAGALGAQLANVPVELARTETVTLVVIHEFALRYSAMAAVGGSRLPDVALANAVPYLFDERAAQRAAANLEAIALSGQPR